MPDLIITGMPRSGTTLRSPIIGLALNAPCLSKPGHGHDWEAMHAARDSADLEASANSSSAAPFLPAVLDRWYADGSAGTNYLADVELGRHRGLMGSWRSISRPRLSRDFTLDIKGAHCMPRRPISSDGWFPVVATVRGPMAVLMSWWMLGLLVSDALAGGGALLDQKMAGPDPDMGMAEKQRDGESILLSLLD